MDYNDPSNRFTKVQIEAHINEWARTNEFSTLDQILDHAPRHYLLFIGQTGSNPLVFSALVAHPDPLVRLSLMMNDNLPQDTLRTLLRDSEEVVLVLVCKHPGTKRKWLWRLLVSKYHLVRSTAFQRIFGFHWSTMIPVIAFSLFIFFTIKLFLK